MRRRLLLLATAVLALAVAPALRATEPESAPDEATASETSTDADVQTRGPGRKPPPTSPSRRRPPNSTAQPSASTAAGGDGLAVPAVKPALRPKRKDSTPDADQRELAEPPPRRPARRIQGQTDADGPDAPPSATAARRRPAGTAADTDADAPEPPPAPIRRWKPGRFFGGTWETAPPLRTKRMDPNARKPGEEAGYLSPAERQSARAHVGKKRNHLTDGDGKPLDTDGKQLYVIDKQGNLFVSNSEVRRGKQHFYHSSFLSGGDVAAAGFIEIQRGKVTYLDNMSGHYKPSAQQLQNAASHLRAQGVGASQMDVVASPQSIMAAPPAPIPARAGAVAPAP